MNKGTQIEMKDPTRNINTHAHHAISISSSAANKGGVDLLRPRVAVPTGLAEPNVAPPGACPASAQSGCLAGHWMGWAAFSRANVGKCSERETGRVLQLVTEMVSKATTLVIPGRQAQT